MTLNQIILRLKTVILAHKQIRRFKIGLAGDFFTDKTAKYPAACLLYNSGGIAIVDGKINIGFRLELLDLVNVAQETKTNEQDVLSDTLSIIGDIIASINSPQWTDWRISTDNIFQSLQEFENDLSAGWYIDFTVSAMFKQNICVIPTDVFGITIVGDGTSESSLPGTDKSLYDVIYIATGAEGTTLNIPEMLGKKVMALGTRNNNPIYKVSSAPDSTEFIADGAVITLGVPVTMAGERFLFLYRNY